MTTAPNLLADALRDCMRQIDDQQAMPDDSHHRKYDTLLAAHDAATHASAQQAEPVACDNDENRAAVDEAYAKFHAQQAGTRVTDEDVERACMAYEDEIREEVFYIPIRPRMRAALESFAAAHAQPTLDGARQGDQSIAISKLYDVYHAAWHAMDDGEDLGNGDSRIANGDLVKALDAIDEAYPPYGDEEIVSLHALLRQFLTPTPASVPAQGDDETMRKDAERYRWLRSLESGFSIRRCEADYEPALWKGFLDNAIDAAIAASNPIASSAEGKGAKILQGNDRGSGGGT